MVQRLGWNKNAKPLYNICPRKKWDKLILYSNRKLVSAIHLYENLVLLKFGRVYMKELISKWSELSSEINKLEINSKLKVAKFLKLCVNCTHNLSTAMSITITPFTKQQLLPQEEKLEVARQK
jgi:hypothetical protein